MTSPSAKTPTAKTPTAKTQSVKLRPGRNLVRLAGGLLAMSLLTFVWPDVVWLFPFAVVVAVILAVLDRQALKDSFPQISVERTTPVVVGRDLPFQAQLLLRSSGRSALSGELRDLLPSAAMPNYATHPFTFPDGAAELSFSTRLQIPIRGSYEFGPVWIRLIGRFGMLEAQRTIGETSSVRVLPEAFASRDKLAKDLRAEAMLLDKLTVARQHGVGTEFESLVEFRQGDDPRRIDWRTTARYRRPIVRRYQIERHRDVMILVDSGRLMGAETGHGTKLDCAVDAALMLGRVALETGDRCGLGIFDDQVIGYLPPVSGLPSIHSLTECVYDLQSRWRESDFTRMFAMLQAKQSKRSLVVIISDIVDAETSRRFRTSLATLARRHVVLFAALQTPLLGRIVHSPVDSLLDGSRKAVAFRVLREREVAVHSVRRSGVHVLDVEPSQLTVPLINQFVELRQRNLL